MVSALQLSAKLLYDQQQLNKALQKLQNAEKILEQTYPDSRQRDKAKLKAEKGNLFLQLQQADSSIQNFKDGLLYFHISNTGYFPDHTVTTLYAGLAKAFAKQQPDAAVHSGAAILLAGGRFLRDCRHGDDLKRGGGRLRRIPKEPPISACTPSR